MIKIAAPSGVPLFTMVVLMAAVFTVSMGYGVVLPLLPYLIERLLGLPNPLFTRNVRQLIPIKQT